MRVSTIVLGITALFLFPLHVRGTGGQDIPFQAVSADDGLSQATVNAIAQDETGFLWLGTQDGFNRYDGYDFHIYRANPEDDCAVGASWIRVAYVDRAGKLWIGTRDGGLNWFDVSTGCFKKIRHHESDPNSLTHDDVISILEDSKGTFWVGTRGGLNRLDRETGRVERILEGAQDPGGVGHDRVRALYEDTSGVLWIGTSSGLNAYDGTDVIGVFRHDPLDEQSLSHNVVRMIFEDGRGRLWVGTSAGLNLLDRDTGRFQRVLTADENHTGPDGMVITSMVEDSQGVLWVGLLRKGILLINGDGSQRWLRHRKDDPKSLGHNDVRRIFIDRTGVVWVGTDGGLNRFDRGSLRFSIIGEVGEDTFGLSNPWVWAVTKDREGILWVGTDGDGIDRLDRERRTVTNFRATPGDANSLSHNRVRCIIQDRAGEYWAGTDGGGLERFTCHEDGNGGFYLRIEHYQHREQDPESIADNWVLALLEDRNGYLLAGTQEGLTRFSPDRLSAVTFRHDPQQPGSLSHNEILCLLEDEQGRLWVGTRNGLNRLDEDSGDFQSFEYELKNPQSLSHNVVRCMAEDKTGNLWIGTYGGGLNKRTPDGRFLRYKEEDGLANNVVYGVLVDGSGHVWCSTNRGLSRLNALEGSFKNYTTGDGLQAHEFNSGAWYGGADGEMFFGGIRGLSYFFPQYMMDDPFLPTPAFTRIKVDGLEYDENQAQVHGLSQISLRPENHSVSIEFSALHYADSQRNQYVYMLDGFEKSWQQAPASRRFASYTNLDPGSYVFKVKAANKDGVWNVNPIEMKVEVLPPIWLTFWAKCVYVALPFIFFFLYQRRQRAITLKLEHMVSKRTGQLNAKNQQLLATQHELVSAAHAAGMAEIASAILHNAGNVLNSVNTSAHLIKDGLDKMPLESLERAAQLLVEQGDDLPHFLSDHPKGRKMVPFLESLSKKMGDKNNDLARLAGDLVSQLGTLKEIVAQQDAYVSSAFHWERIHLQPVVASALKIMDSRLEEAGVRVELKVDKTPKISILKTKLTQGLVNIIKNACDAMTDDHSEDNVLSVRILAQDQGVCLIFADNGSGIEPDLLDKVFTQGFSTRPASQGLGLHACANAMAEMGGSIEARNGTDGRGAVFTLRFPLQAQD